MIRRANFNLRLFVVMSMCTLPAICIPLGLQWDSNQAFASCADLVAKQPWQMTRQEWIDSGSPDLGIESALMQDPDWICPWEQTEAAEIQAINDFMSLFPNPVAAIRKGLLGPYDGGHEVLSDRQEQFAKLPWKHRNWSSLYGQKSGSLEDVREAILVGRKLGYPDKDILFYLVRNYIVNRFIPEVDRNNFLGTAIPEDVKVKFPALRRYKNF